MGRGWTKTGSLEENDCQLYDILFELRFPNRLLALPHNSPICTKHSESCGLPFKSLYLHFRPVELTLHLISHCVCDLKTYL